MRKCVAALSCVFLKKHPVFSFYECLFYNKQVRSSTNNQPTCICPSFAVIVMHACELWWWRGMTQVAGGCHLQEVDSAVSPCTRHSTLRIMAAQIFLSMENGSETKRWEIFQNSILFTLYPSRMCLSFVLPPIAATLLYNAPGVLSSSLPVPSPLCICIFYPCPLVRSLYIFLLQTILD